MATSAPSVKFSFPTSSPYLVRCDRRLALTADIAGSPSPRVSWYLDRTPLAGDGPEYRLNSDGSGARVYCTPLYILVAVCSLQKIALSYFFLFYR